MFPFWIDLEVTALFQTLAAAVVAVTWLVTGRCCGV